jgi:hypothetical protein
VSRADVLLCWVCAALLGAITVASCGHSARTLDVICARGLR